MIFLNQLGDEMGGLIFGDNGGNGHFGSFTWDASQTRVIADVSGCCQSPGGACFAGRKLWIAGSYGDSLGSIDPQSWNVESLFKGRLRDDSATQSYASMAGPHLFRLCPSILMKMFWLLT
jgi:hypothetical protein